MKMMHFDQALARTVVGVIGNVLSFGMFLAPAPSTFWRIWKKKSTEEFHPYPQLATTMNCLLWIFYGLPIVHPDSTLVITINAVGLALQAIYLGIFFWNTTKRYRLIIIGMLCLEIAFLGVVAAITLLCFHTHHNRSMFVGIITVIFGIIMYGSPLSNLRNVIKTKSVKFMQIWLIVAGCSNGWIWFTYAFLKVFDPYILASNGTGAMLGVIQILVYLYYGHWRTGDDDDDDGNKPRELQLPISIKTLPV